MENFLARRRCNLLLLGVSKDEEEFDTYILEVRFNRKTKLPFFQRATKGGLRQDLPDGTPAEIGYDAQGRTNFFARYDQDAPHCEFEGAIVRINPETGVRYSEQFYLKGEPYPKALGPKHITRREDTGDVIGVYFDENDADAESPGSDPSSKKPGIELKM